MSSRFPSYQCEQNWCVLEVTWHLWRKGKKPAQHQAIVSDDPEKSVRTTAKELQVAEKGRNVRPWPPYVTVVYRSGVLAVIGPMGQLLDALTSSLNTTYKATVPADWQVGVCLPNGTWTGMVGLVQRREVDMTIMPLIQTYSRYAVGEYSPVIMYVPFGILSASDVSTSNVFGFILTFDWKVWAVLLCAIPILALLISLSEFVLHGRSWKNIPQEVHQRGWELFGNLLYESSPRPTSQTSGRIVLTSWLLAVLVIANSFAGHLKSSMAVKNEPAQVDSVLDVVNRPSLRPIIWKGTYYEALISGSPSPLLKRLWRMVQRNNGSLPGRIIYSDANMREVIERRAVFMVDHNSQRYHLAAFCRRGSVSSFHFGREIIEENKLSFLMSRSMRRDLHRHIYTRITWLYESGLVTKWLADELGDWQRCVRRTGEHVAKDLSIDDTLAAFVLWGMVMGAAAVALIVETLRRPRDGRSSPEILFQRRTKMLSVSYRHRHQVNLNLPPLSKKTKK